MANYALIPAYYEWHLVDTEQPQDVLLNINDPGEEMYWHDEDADTDTPKTYEDVLEWAQDIIDTALRYAEEGEEYEGVMVSEDRLPDNAAEIIAKALYEYYIYEEIPE